MKKLILRLLGIFMIMMCLGGIFSLFVILWYADFQQGKVVVIIFFLLMIAGFGAAAFKCFKFVNHKNETEKNPKVTNSPCDRETHIEHEDISSITGMEINVLRQEVPQKILNDMRISYTRQQAINDMRIIDESLAIMERTSDIDTFLSRYETAMRCALTLEQAKKAGVAITLPDEGFSQSLINAKEKALSEVLYRSFDKELNEINKLKTERGKLIRIDKYQEKLKGMYEDIFESVAEDAYNDVIQKLEFLKNNTSNIT